MLKRLLIVAALTLAATLPSAASAAEKVEISYWAPFSGGDGDFMKAMVAEYNASQDEVEVKFLIHKMVDYYIKLRTAAGSGRGPDLAVVHASQIASMMRDDLILPMDDVAAAANIDWSRFDADILASTVVDGKHMSIPLDTHCLALFVNTKIAGELGLLNADGSVKLEAGGENFLNFLRAYKAVAPAGGIPLAANMDGNMTMWLWWCLYSQLDGKLYSEDGSKAAFNNPDSARALDFIAKMVAEGLWPKGLKSGYEVFKAGKALATFEGVWATGDYEKAGLEFTILPFPDILGKPRSWGDAHTLALTRQNADNDAKRAAAASFAYWLAENGYDWALSGQIPSMPEVLASDKFKKLPHREHLARIVKGVSFFPASARLDPTKEAMIQNFSQFIATFPAADKMLTRMEKDVNRVLAR